MTGSSGQPPASRGKGYRWVQTATAPTTTMQCHYCDRDAEVAVEKDDVIVGLCDAHFEEQLESLADADWLEEFDEELDVDSAE